MLQYNPTVSGSLNITGSLQVSGDITGTVNGINITGLSQSVSSQLITVQSSTGSSDAKFNTLSSVTSSALTRLTNIESKSASVDISISNINSITASNIARLSNLETKSSSVDISISSINSFTSSNANTSLNSKTGSYATTGSNSFYGTQVFSGSVYIANDLVVQGSSSIQYISASSVSIGTNIVQLNTATPSVRYAGLAVQDSGSSAGITGSILWDSLCNRWMYSNPSTIGYSGGIIMSGPRASTLGSETTLTCNYIAKSGGGDHLYDSAIYESGSCVGIGTATPGDVLEIGGLSTNQGLLIKSPSSQPRLQFYAGGAAADNRIWDFIPQNSGILVGRVLNDAGSAANTWVSVTRSGAAISSVAFPCGITCANCFSSISAQFNPYSSAGTAGTPVFQDAILLGQTANIAKIQYGNSFVDNNGSWLRFVVNGSTATNTPVNVMTLKYDGSVGIGTTSPTSLLSICGTFSDTTPLINITGTGTGTYQKVISVVNPGMAVGNDLMIQMGSALSCRNAGQIYFHSDGAGCPTNRMSIGLYQIDNVLNINACTNVGINTTAPGTTLMVNRNIPDSNWGTIAAFDSQTSAAGVGGVLTFGGFKCSQTFACSIFARIIGGKENSTTGDECGYLAFYTNNNSSYVERIRVRADGNVGIGTNTIPNDHILQISNSGQAYARMALTNSVTGNASGDGLIFQLENCTAIIKNQEPNCLILGANGRETDIVINQNGTVGVGASALNKFTVFTSASNALDVFDTGASFGLGMQAVNAANTVYKSWDFYASKFNFLNGPTIFSNTACITGSGYGLYFTGGNNRIYFGTCRAIEGSTSGTTLQIGENYDKTQIQSSAQMYNGSAGNSPKLYFGAEGNETVGAKAIYLETYWMIIQPHVNEGLRFRAVNASGTQYTIAKMYGTGTFSLDQYSNGTLSVSSGVVVSSSDKCMKIDDGGIDTALPKIMCLNPRYFYWKPETCLNSCDRQLGFYAQDVSEVLGEEVANQSHNCSWGIYDRGIIAMLTKGMQEQQCRIKLLESCLGIS